MGPVLPSAPPPVEPGAPSSSLCTAGSVSPVDSEVRPVADDDDEDDEDMTPSMSSAWRAITRVLHGISFGSASRKSVKIKYIRRVIVQRMGYGAVEVDGRDSK